MWKRLRRRTFAPSRPLLYDDQIGLAVLVAAAVIAGLYFLFKLAI
jgi:malic enzyme